MVSVQELKERQQKAFQERKAAREATGTGPNPNILQGGFTAAGATPDPVEANQSLATANQSLATPEDLAQQSLAPQSQIEALQLANATDTIQNVQRNTQSILDATARVLRNEVFETAALALVPAGALGKAAKVAKTAKGASAAFKAKQLAIKNLAQQFTISKGTGEIGKTAVQQSLKIGGKGITKKEIMKGTSAGQLKYNTKTLKLTESFFGRVFGALGTGSKIVLGGALAGAIGSYPFAGFIREEALQTLDLGVKTAQEQGLFDEAEFVLEQQDAILERTTEEKIVAAVPYSNVQSALIEYFQAARIKVAINRGVNDEMRKEREQGESESEIYLRRESERREREQSRREEEEAYYSAIAEEKKNAERRARENDRQFFAVLDAENKIKAAKLREEERQYYENIEAEKDRKRAERRLAEEAYYTEVYRKADERRLAISAEFEKEEPSNLNFGLI